MLALFKEAARSFSEDDCSRMAAALAYYTAFSLGPLLILLLLLAGLFFDPAEVERHIAGQAGAALGPEAADQIVGMLRSASVPSAFGLRGLLGLAGLLFGATGVVTQLQAALNDVWHVRPDPEKGSVLDFLTKRLLSLGMVLGLAFVLVVSLATSTLISAFGEQLALLLPGALSASAATTVDLGVTLVVLTAIFAAIFKVLPDARIAWRDVLFGAGFTAALFVLGKFGLGWYLGRAGVGSTFGAAGSLALILLWVYYSAMILLFGAELTQARACQGGRPILPMPGAVRVPPRKPVEREPPPASRA